MLFACSSGSNAGAPASGSGSAGSGSAAPVKKTGFSASLSAELKGSDQAPGLRPQASGSDTKPLDVKAPDTKAPDTKPPDTKPPDTKAPDTKPPDTKPPDTKTPDAKPPDMKPPPLNPAKPEAPPATKSSAPTASRAELLAIKFELLPNWERDVTEAGTIQLVVKLPKSTATRTFTFRYGYEDPAAPTDRDQYKKWLADTKTLDVKTDRQRGAAWYLENNESFRFLVTYGGKRLICYGSQYRDSASNPLGDLRDEVVMQAKKICESLSL